MSTDYRKRKYELKARAERQRQTRERIVASTVALHRTIGPARTTIKEIARLAGVQRVTVYNTFPEARDLFGACQRHFLAETPPPDLAPRPGTSAWRSLQDALAKLYRWYRATEAMERNVHRDRHIVPALDELMARTADAQFAAMARAHAGAITGRKRQPAVAATIRLAFQFSTWDLLNGHGFADAAMARLMTRLVRAAAARV